MQIIFGLQRRLSNLKRTRARDPSVTVSRNIEMFMLLELLREPTYGCDLIKTLAELGFKRAVMPKVVYKALRSMEEIRAIRSKWSPQESGPAHRYYKTTEDRRALFKESRRSSKTPKGSHRAVTGGLYKTSDASLNGVPATESSQQKQRAAGRHNGVC